jgi:hypothetical protein
MPKYGYNPFTKKLDRTLTDAEIVALLADNFLKLDCSNDPLTDDLAISQAGVSFMTVGSTDHLVAGIRFQRSDWGTDIYTDYSFYDNSAGDLLLDKLISAVTTNILTYDEDIARWTFTGDVYTASIFNGGIVRTNNYQNSAGDESFVWADADDWWELSNDLKVMSDLEVVDTGTFGGTSGVAVRANNDIILKSGERLVFDGS